ncbi:MAG: hypothetical protein M1824_002586 [Vezdaea acicularis]|nr:MAG: hypothetical protein M1824_002586 [Vezdaea acicularis]
MDPYADFYDDSYLDMPTTTSDSNNPIYNMPPVIAQDAWGYDTQDYMRYAAYSGSPSRYSPPPSLPPFYTRSTAQPSSSTRSSLTSLHNSSTSTDASSSFTDPLYANTGSRASLSAYPSTSSSYSPTPSHTSETPAEMAGFPNSQALLSFSPAVRPAFTLLDSSNRVVSVDLSAQLSGMFFLAEPATDDGQILPGPPQLTCYRRNLFQVAGNVTLPKDLRYLQADGGQRLPIVGVDVSIVATESVENASVKLISVPWKTPPSGSADALTPHPADPKVEAEPRPVAIPLTGSPNSHSAASTVQYTNNPVTFRRLQFRTATANNGRRRELQQHFTLGLKLTIHLGAPAGAKAVVCEVRSGKIIVRGRSPRNFVGKHEIPLSGSASRKGSRKASPGSEDVSAPTGSVGLGLTSAGYSEAIAPVTTSQDNWGYTPYAYSQGDVQMDPHFMNWIRQPGSAAGTLPAQTAATSVGMRQGQYATADDARVWDFGEQAQGYGWDHKGNRR